MSLKFVVTSKNKIKVDAVKDTLAKILSDDTKFTVVGVSVPSGVSDQPMSLEETKRGAINRINNVKEEDADYIISIESGFELEFDCYYNTHFCAVSNGKKTKFGFGTSTKFPVPEYVTRKVITKGVTSGTVLHSEEGMISVLTNGLKTRTMLCSEALITALIPFHFFKTATPENVPAETLKYVDDKELNQLDKNRLFAQLRELDFTPITNLSKKSTSGLDVSELTDVDEAFEDILSNGVEAIKAGEVAVIIMAGGQGSRLGSPIPKALVQLDIPSKQSLLEIQLRKVKKLLSLYRQYNQGPKGIPVYILTSEDTHSAIAAYLIAKQNFGLSFVRLIKQENLPARLPDGTVAMRTKSQVLSSPNGNGSIYETLLNTGALEEMEKMGIKYVECHPIDNCLAKPADPLFIGAMIYEGAEAALKVIKKASPEERVGTVCKRDGRNVIVEYSEIQPAEASKHMYGNTAIHCFTIELLRRAAEASLPYHIAIKQENTVNGKVEVHKFERFIFDALELSENTALIEVKREEEFAPVKNAPGSKTDSPETARALYLAEHRRWAEENEITLQGDGDFEIRPELSYQGEGLDPYSGMTLTLPMLL